MRVTRPAGHCVGTIHPRLWSGSEKICNSWKGRKAERRGRRERGSALFGKWQHEAVFWSQKKRVATWPLPHNAQKREHRFPSRSIVLPSRSILAPPRSILTLLRSIVAPPRSIVSPTRSIPAPSRSIVKPSRSLLRPSPSIATPFHHRDTGAQGKTDFTTETQRHREEVRGERGGAERRGGGSGGETVRRSPRATGLSTPPTRLGGQTSARRFVDPRPRH